MNLNYYMENETHGSISFDSMEDVMDCQMVRADNYSAAKHFLGGKKSPRYNWYGAGNITGSDVVRKAIYGDTKLLDKLTSMNNKMDVRNNISGEQHIVKARKRKLRWRDQGDELDIHKVYAGDLDKAWRVMKHIEQDKTHHHVVLMINIGCNQSVTYDETLWRACVAVKVADSIISAGKSVKIIVGSSTSDLSCVDSRIYTTMVTVKDYNEPLPMERLAAMTHAGFHRTVTFASRCAIPKRIHLSTMGHSNDDIRHRAPLHIKEEGDGVKYVYIGQCVNEQDAMAEVKHIKRNWA